MKKAKIMSLLLALSLTAGLMSGCGSSTETSAAAESEQTETSAEASSEAASSEAASAEESTEGETTAETEETFDYSGGLTTAGLFEGVTALDYVTLPEYQGIDLTGDIPEISNETIQEQIDNLLGQYSSYEQLTDREVADGDTVNIDYVGSVDGIEFDGGNTQGMGTDVTIGVTQYIDDFLEQLIGHKPGETFDVEVTFPDPYENNEELSGKDAVFVTTINYIQGEEIIPELTDEFVAENLSADYGFTTAEEVRTYILDRNIDNYLADYLFTNSTVSEIPEEISSFHENYLINSYKTTAAQYGMDLETYLSYFVGVSTIEDALAANEEDLKQSATLSLIYQAIAEGPGTRGHRYRRCRLFQGNWL